MTFKEIQDLLKFISKSDLSEVRIKDSEFEITVRNKNYTKGGGTPTLVSSHPVSVAAPVVQSPEPQTEAKAPAAQTAQAAESTGKDNTEGLLEIKSPIVGTFYRSSSPDKPPFVSVGDSVGEGQVVCIVEAINIINEIESEVSGKIVKVLIEDASPVEYDQVLFLVDPKG